MTEKRSYTVWNRLEPLVRNEELTGTLRGELADPLWLLARQRQFGEFNGEDAGSPVDTTVKYGQDEVSRIEVGATTHEYDPSTDPPVETLVEREMVGAAAADADREAGAPNHAVRAEAGMHFLDRLRRAVASHPTGGPLPEPDRFDASVHLTGPEIADAQTNRFIDVCSGADGTPRALDGHAVYGRLVDVAPHVGDPETATDWSAVTDPVTLLVAPGEQGMPASAFQTAAEGFAEWYAALYAEPTPDEDAWDPDRMEYETRVSAGAGSDETVFKAGEYEGGRLDWFDFEAEAGALRGDGPETPTKLLSDPPTSASLPTNASFRGMPASRLWELEDGAVDLASISAAADDLSRLFMLEFALIAGDDWFTLPITAPVGSVTRITELTVTDTFGVTTDPVEATTNRADAADWDMFTFDLPNHAEPGLYLPPVVGSVQSGDPIDSVEFGRDELANLVFGLEEIVEGGLGQPLDRTEFRNPSLAIGSIEPSPSSLSGQDAADAETVALRNEGDDSLALTDPAHGSWTLRVTTPEREVASFDLGAIEIPAEDDVELVIGGDATQDTDEVVHLEHPTPVLTPAATVHVDRPTPNGPGLVDVAPVEPDRLTELDAYRLASAVEDHWFPFVPTTASDQTHRLELGVLLDEDALSGTVDAVPRPMGRLIDTDACLYDEEVTRTGTRVTRHFHASAWLDGTTHVWSGREVTPGTGELSSGLRFDYLTADDGE
jgi:hypothetical protein